MKERMKNWFKVNAPWLFGLGVTFSSGVIFGIVTTEKRSYDSMMLTSKNSFNDGYATGRKDTINHICNHIVHEGKPIKFTNNDTGESIYIGSVDVS